MRGCWTHWTRRTPGVSPGAKCEEVFCGPVVGANGPLEVGRKWVRRKNLTLHDGVLTIVVERLLQVADFAHPLPTARVGRQGPAAVRNLL